MTVKTYRARTAAEALAQVRAELGERACIVETRRTARGVEVVAAAERPGARMTAPVALPAVTQGAEQLREDLSLYGFSPVLADRIAAAAASNLDPEQLADREVALAYARDVVALFVPPDPPRAERGTRVLVVVGSPGVGKTTTLAKLAAREVARVDRNVVLASADDRRLGGAEQIEAYARVLGVPFRLVKDRRDIDRARELAGRRGTLFVDTPGIARGDRAGMDRLAALLSGVKSDEIELLLAADREADALAETLRRFAALRPGSIGATRLDETLRTGPVVSAVARAGMPLRHLCGGPNVPDDIEPADARRLAEWAVPFPGRRPVALGTTEVA